MATVMVNAVIGVLTPGICHVAMTAKVDLKEIWPLKTATFESIFLRTNSDITIL